MGKRNLHRLVTAILCLGLFAAPAAASELDQARAAGHVGEQIDGYVGVVSAAAPASAKALVERINQGRRARYGEIAAKNGVSVEAVAARAGVKLVERAPAGEYVRDASGWRKK